jgi:hypothetical protein
MSTDWYLMSPPTFNSGYEKTAYDDFANDGLSELLGVDSPISCEIVKDNVSYQAIIQSTSSNTDKDHTRQIITNFNTLNCCDCIIYDDAVWLVLSNENRKLYDDGTIEQCNYLLPFQDSSGTIILRPCIFKSQSNTIDQNNMISFVSGKATLVLPYDEKTILLREGKRLIVDFTTDIPDTYKISGRDIISNYYDGNYGTITLYLDKDAFSPNVKEDGRFDNVNADIAIYDVIYYGTLYYGQTGMIADYFEKVESSGSASISYNGDCVVKVGGLYQTFYTHFIDVNGAELDLIPSWTFTSSIVGAESNFTTIIDNTNKSIRIK